MKPNPAQPTTLAAPSPPHKTIRVFLSFCTDDQASAERVIKMLRRPAGGCTFDVRGMLRLGPADRFAEQLCGWIESSHVLIVLITPNTIRHPWVYQEIGYALGRCVPVFPVVEGMDPGSTGMLSPIQAVDMARLAALPAAIVQALKAPQAASCPAYSRDSAAARRTLLLADSASRVEADLRLAMQEATESVGDVPCIRQRSRLTSFSIPHCFSEHAWQAIPEGDLAGLSQWLSLNERHAFDRLASYGRCDLIITPSYQHRSYDRRVQQARLRTLRRFLSANCDDSKVKVVVLGTGSRDGDDSVTILGNHWVSFSASVAGAFVPVRETLSSWHAATVEAHCESFDREFANLWAVQAPLRERHCCSSAYAITEIDRALERLGQIDLADGRDAENSS